MRHHYGSRERRGGESAILIGVAECHVPAVGVFVEPGRQIDRIDLHGQHQRRPDLKVTGSSHHAPESRVCGVTPDLVRIGGAGLGIDPPQQRLQAFLVGRIDEEIDEGGGTSQRLAHVTEHGVPIEAIVPLQCDDRVADVGRLDVLPIEIGGVASDREIEFGRDAFPEFGKARRQSVEAVRRRRAAVARGRRS